jgi:hypothetical protein
MEKTTNPTCPNNTGDEVPDARLRSLDPFISSFENLLSKSKQTSKFEFYKRKTEIMRELLKNIQKLNKSMPINDKTIKVLMNSSVNSNYADPSRNIDDSQFVLKEIFSSISKRTHSLELQLGDQEQEDESNFKNSLKKIRRN